MEEIILTIDYNCIFVTLITLLNINLSIFSAFFFLKGGMLYNILAALHLFPNVKGSLFSKIPLCKN